MIRNIIILFFLLFVFGCDSNRIYEKNVEIDNKSWSLTDAKVFETEIKDTNTVFNILINIRHTSSYSFSNLWMFVHTTSPNSIITSDTVQVAIANPSGKWLGSRGLADIWNVQAKLKSIRFTQQGAYSFEIEQAMRYGEFAEMKTLNDIVDVGLRIEKQDKKDYD